MTNLLIISRQRWWKRVKLEKGCDLSLETSPGGTKELDTIDLYNTQYPHTHHHYHLYKDKHKHKDKYKDKSKDKDKEKNKDKDKDKGQRQNQHLPSVPITQLSLVFLSCVSQNQTRQLRYLLMTMLVLQQSNDQKKLPEQPALACC